MADHLFSSPEKPPRRLQIEYSGPQYDGGPWPLYPNRQGWDPAVFDENPNAPTIPAEYLPSLECWFYFGVLHAVFGDKFKQEDFMHAEDDGRQSIRSGALQSYINGAICRRGNTLLKAIQDILLAAFTHLNKPKVRGCIRPEMLFAIHILGASLFHVAQKQSPSLQISTYNNPLWGTRNQWADDQMLSLGWCASEVERFSYMESVLTQAYALQLRRPSRRDPSVTHSSCTKSECYGNHINEGTYQTKHVQPDCTCEHLGPKIEEVQAILRRGGTPIIRISNSKNKTSVKLEVLQYRVGRRYVAISHVWSDGLGNAQGNSLPLCQIRILKEKTHHILWDSSQVPGALDNPVSLMHTGASYVTHFAGNVVNSRKDTAVLWIDTLCVPRDRETRNLAIRGMKKAYEDAYRTIVLDSELMSTPSLKASKEEILLRILTCSSWMRRLWTLQEGLAARRRLYVAFSDQTIGIPDMADKLWLKHDRGRFEAFHEPIVFDAFETWFMWFRSPTTASSTFEKVLDKVIYLGPSNSGIEDHSTLLSRSWGNVSARATSRDEDRPIILAGVIDLDARDLLNIRGDAEKRMKKFYEMLSKFPQDVLFEPGERFDEDGWRWALKTCRSKDDIVQRGKWNSGRPGIRKSEGLLVESPGIVARIGFAFYQGMGAFWFTTTGRNGENGASIPLRFVRVQAKQGPGIAIFSPHDPTISEVGFVFEAPYQSVRHSLFEDGEENLSCLVISIYKEERYVRFGKFELQAEAVTVRMGNQVPEEISQSNIPELSCDQLVRKQKWCIG